MANDGKIRKEDLLEKGAESVYSDLAKEANDAIKSIAKSLADLDKEQRKLGLSAEDIVTVEKQRNQQLTEAEKLIKRRTQLEEKYALIQSENAKAVAELSKQITVANSKHKERIKTLAQERKETELNNSAYKRLTSELLKVEKKYKDLAAKQAQGIQLSVKEQGELKALTSRLSMLSSAYKKVDADVTRTTGGVRRASSSFDSLGFSVAQITRESPAFINSMNTGFMAISNNIPVLVDEITKLQRKNVELAAQGKSQVNIWKKVGAAFFSWQSLISAGIVLMTIFLPKIINWISNINKASETLKSTNDVLDDFDSSTKKHIGTLIGLTEQLKKTNINENERLSIIKKLKSEYPEFNSEILKEKNNTKLLNTEIDKYIELLINRAKAEALQEDIGNKAAEIAKRQDVLKKASLKLSKEEIESAEDLLEVTDSEKEARNKLTAASFPYFLTLKLQRDAKRELRDMTKSLVSTSEEEEGVVKGTVDYYRDLISNNNKLIESKKTLKDLKEVRRLQNENKQHQKQIDLILNKKKKTKLFTDQSNKIRANEIKGQIEANKVILADDKTTFEESLKLMNANAKLEKSIGALALEDKIAAIDKENILEKEKFQKKVLAKQEFDAFVIATDQKLLKDKEKLGEEEANSYKKVLQDRLNELEIQKNNELRLAREQSKTKEEFDKRSSEITLKFKRLELDISKEILKKQIDELKVLGVKKEVIMELEKLYNLIDSKNINDPFDEEGLSNLEKYQEALQALGSAVDSVAEIVSNTHEANIIALQKEMEALEESYERRKELEGDDADAKKALDKELAAEKKKIDEKIKKEKEKQFIANKKADLAQAAINIALGVTRALSNPATAPFIIPLILATGALQIAAIQNTPIPKFKDGGVMPHTGKALINDGGKREYVERNGMIFSTPVRDAVVDLQQGDIIHKDLNALMNASIMTSLANDNKNMDASKLKVIFDANYSNLESAIKSGFKGVKNNIKITQQKVDIPHGLYARNQKEW